MKFSIQIVTFSLVILVSGAYFLGRMSGRISRIRSAIVAAIDEETRLSFRQKKPPRRPLSPKMGSIASIAYRMGVADGMQKALTTAPFVPFSKGTRRNLRACGYYYNDSVARSSV